MTTLALSAVLAVALSISSTNDYHYVSIPTNMAASITGIGMGMDAPTADASLRYEDVAFLYEALAERENVSSPSATNTRTSVSSGIKYLYMPSVVSAGSGYIDPALPARSGILALDGTCEYNGYSRHGNSGCFYAYHLFGTSNCFVKVNISLPSGSPLTFNAITNAYSSVAKLSRYGQMTSLCCGDTPGGKVFSYENCQYPLDSSPIYSTNTIPDKYLYLQKNFYHRKLNITNPVTGVTTLHDEPSGQYFVYYCDTIPHLYIPGLLTPLEGRKVASVKAYACGYVWYSVSDADTGTTVAEETKYFIAPLVVMAYSPTDGSQIPLDRLTGRDEALTFFKEVCAACSIPWYDTPSAVPATVGDSMVYQMRVKVDSVLVVYEVEFHARVEDGDD